MAQEIVRRAEVPDALAQLGVQMQDQGGYRVVAFPPSLRNEVNILLPVQEIAASDPNFTPSLRMVQLDMEMHTYEQARGKRALNKQGLEVLASGAGILRTATRRIPRSELDEGETGYEARVQIRRSDGSIEEIRREKIVSWDVEKFKVKEAAEAAAQRFGWNAEKFEAELRKRTIAERENLHAKCESKAVLRALRAALQIPHVFTEQQLRKPFLVVGYAFTPNYDDPEIKRMLVAHGLAATADAYGGATEVPSERPVSLNPAPESQRNLDRRVVGPPAEPEPAEGDAPEPAGEAPPDTPTDAAAPAAPAEPPPLPPAEPQGWTPPAYPGGASEPEPPPPGQTSLEEPPGPDPRALAREDAGRVSVPFGRHKGKTIAQVAAEDPGYVKWLASAAQDDHIKRAAEDWNG